METNYSRYLWKNHMWFRLTQIFDIAVKLIVLPNGVVGAQNS